MSIDFYEDIIIEFSKNNIFSFKTLFNKLRNKTIIQLPIYLNCQINLLTKEEKNYFIDAIISLYIYQQNNSKNSKDKKIDLYSYIDSDKSKKSIYALDLEEQHVKCVSNFLIKNHTDKFTTNKIKANLIKNRHKIIISEKNYYEHLLNYIDSNLHNEFSRIYFEIHNNISSNKNQKTINIKILQQFIRTSNASGKFFEILFNKMLEIQLKTNISNNKRDLSFKNLEPDLLIIDTKYFLFDLKLKDFSEKDEDSDIYKSFLYGLLSTEYYSYKNINIIHNILIYPCNENIISCKQIYKMTINKIDLYLYSIGIPSIWFFKKNSDIYKKISEYINNLNLSKLSIKELKFNPNAFIDII